MLCSIILCSPRNTAGHGFTRTTSWIMSLRAEYSALRMQPGLPDPEAVVSNHDVPQQRADCASECGQVAHLVESCGRKASAAGAWRGCPRKRRNVGRDPPRLAFPAPKASTSATGTRSTKTQESPPSSPASPVKPQITPFPPLFTNSSKTSCPSCCKVVSATLHVAVTEGPSPGTGVEASTIAASRSASECHSTGPTPSMSNARNLPYFQGLFTAGPLRQPAP